MLAAIGLSDEDTALGTVFEAAEAAPLSQPLADCLAKDNSVPICLLEYPQPDRAQSPCLATIQSLNAARVFSVTHPAQLRAHPADKRGAWEVLKQVRAAMLERESTA